MKRDRSAKSMERLFATIRAAHAKQPDLRVAQIICNAVGDDENGPFYYENDVLSELIAAAHPKEPPHDPHE